MKKNIVLIAFFAILGFMLIGVIFAVIKLTGSNNKSQTANQVVHIDLDKEKEIFDSKVDAYNQLINDSIKRVRDENVKINLSQLWNKKTQKDTTTDIKQLLEEVTNPKPKPKPKSKSNPKPKPQTKVITKIDTVYIDSQPKEPAYKRKNGFHSSFNNDATNNTNKNLIHAVIHSSQKITNGSIIKLRFTQDFVINGQTIPDGTFLNAVCQLTNERVILKFASFAYDNVYYPFRNYSAFDPDGWEGIYVKGLVVSNAVKEAVNQTTAQTKINIPIIGNVALNTARKENNINYVTLSQDYPVIIKNTQQ